MMDQGVSALQSKMGYLGKCDILWSGPYDVSQADHGDLVVVVQIAHSQGALTTEYQSERCS
jgi:hypothetical protein